MAIFGSCCRQTWNNTGQQGNNICTSFKFVVLRLFKINKQVQEQEKLNIVSLINTNQQTFVKQFLDNQKIFFLNFRQCPNK